MTGADSTGRTDREPHDGAPRVRHGNLAAGLPTSPLGDELVETLLESPDGRVERIVSTGQISTDWYDQDTDELVVLLSGAARLRLEHEAEDRPLVPGDWIVLPARCRHRVTQTRAEPPTVWLAVHLRPA